MPATFSTELTERDAKAVLLDTCRSPTSAQNLERLMRCLLQFWDAAKCVIAVDNDVSSEVFENLRYAPENIENVDLSTLSILDIKVFLHLAVHCAYVRSERTKEKPGKFSSLATADQLTSDRQRNFWRAAWALTHNAGKPEDRVRLQEGLETIRLKSRDIPELPLLVSVAAMLESEVPETHRYSGQDSKAVAASDYAKLYWASIDNIWERDRILQPKPDAFFYAGLPPLPRSRRDHYRSLSKYYHALNALMHGKEDQCVNILEGMQTPVSFFALAQIYKNSAQNIDGRQSDRDAAVHRRAMLVKAREALRSCMRKLEEHASSGVLNELEIGKALDDVETLISVSNLALVPSNGEATKQQQGDVSGLSNDLRMTPLTPSTTGYFTPASSRFVPPRGGLSTPQAAASASLLLELGQSVDYVLRSLTQSQETLVRGIMDQNRALTNTCDSMISQLKELTLTNKALVDEMKDMRRENADYRTLLTTIDSVRNRSNVADESYASYSQPLAPSQAFPVTNTLASSAVFPSAQCMGSSVGFPPTHPAASWNTVPVTQSLPPSLPIPVTQQWHPCLVTQKTSSSNAVPATQPFVPSFGFPVAHPLTSTVAFAAAPLTTMSLGFSMTQPTAPSFGFPVTHAVTSPFSVPVYPPPQQAHTAPAPQLQPPTQPPQPHPQSQATRQQPQFSEELGFQSDVKGYSQAIEPKQEKLPLTQLEMFKPKPGSWACNDCYTRNEVTATRCICCGAAGPSTSTSSSSAVSKGPSISLGLPVTSSTPAVQFPQAAATSTAPSTAVPISNPLAALGALVTKPTFGVFGPQSSSVPSFASLANQPVAPSFQPFQGFKGFGDSGSPLFGKMTTSTPQRTRQESEQDDNESAEAFEPTVDFKPVVPLPALVETKSGEEEEEVLFRERAKLYRWEPSSKEFKERGLGDLKILKHRDTGAVRVLMRREQVFKLCANHRITPGMKLSALQKSDRAFTWSCQDYSEEELKQETLAVKFKEVVAAHMFKLAFEAAVRQTESPVKGSTAITDFGDHGKVIREATTQFPQTATTATITTPFSTSSITDFSRFGQGATATFGLPVTSTSIPARVPLFVSTTPSQETNSTSDVSAAPALDPRPVFGTLGSHVSSTSSSSMPSFASLANQPQAPSFQAFQGFKGFGDIASPLFGKMTTSTPQRTRQESEQDDNESAETFEPTVDFQPVVPLPALVETKSGEEEEEILFRERARLFRWEPSSKEFKERGLGEMKILKHRDTGAIRVLMRREQVFKLCANHRITPGMKLSPMQKSDRAFTWSCQDYSEEELKQETLAVKFKEVEAANKFKEAFEKAAGQTDSPVKASPSITGSGDQGDDVTISYEVKVTMADAVLAAEYQLPKTFFVEHPCPGCIGCASEEVQDEFFRQMSHNE